MSRTTVAALAVAAAMAVACAGGGPPRTSAELPPEAWTDAPGSIKLPNGVSVAVTHAGVKHVSLVAGGAAAESDEPYLNLILGISMTGPADAKGDYRLWGRDDRVRCRDSRKNDCAAATFPAGAQIVGQLARPAVLTPGGPVKDLLVFKAPAKGADYVLLELPADAVGGEGALRFRVKLPKE